MARKITITSAKRRARSAFSEYIRKRDTKDGWGNCITCGANKPYEELDAGHFRKATGSLTLFDERNVQAQCIRCNRFEDGRQYDHGKELEKRLGVEPVEELTFLSRQTHHFTIEELEEIVQKYRQKVKEL